MSLRQTNDRLALTPWYTMCQLRPEFNTSSVGEKFHPFGQTKISRQAAQYDVQIYHPLSRLPQPLTWRMVYQVPAAVA